MRLALIGHPGSGKSSIAEALGVRLTFALAVKKEVADLIAPITDAREADIFLDNTGRYMPDVEGTARELLKEMESPDTKDRYRTLLQLWGTDFRRGQDPDYWVKQMMRRIDHLIAADSETDLIVDDCRFPNERNALRVRSFKFVRLESGASTRPLTGTQLAHESERYWPTWPVELVLSYQPGPENQAERIRAHFEGESS